MGLVRHGLKIIGRSGERQHPSERALSGLDHVGQQQGAGHGPHSAGVGREPGGHLVNAVGDVTGDAALAGGRVDDARDTHVQDDGAGGNHLRGDDAGAAGRRDDDVGPARAEGTVRRIADELEVHPEALRSWVKKARVDGGLRSETTTNEAARIKELEKEAQELRRANAILTSASACLSRRSVSARLADLPVNRGQEGGARGLADLPDADQRRRQDRPEHVTHAAKTRPPAARSLRGEALKTEVSKIHKNQLLGAGSPQDACDAGPP